VGRDGFENLWIMLLAWAAQAVPVRPSNGARRLVSASGIWYRNKSN
jgi:hypothetical protein